MPIPIVESRRVQKLDRDEFVEIKVIELPSEYPFAPCAVWSIVDPGDLNTPCRKINHKQHMESNQSLGGPDFNSEEVFRRDGLPMHPQELSPIGSLLRFGAGSS